MKAEPNMAIGLLPNVLYVALSGPRIRIDFTLNILPYHPNYRLLVYDFRATKILA
jgi:hypothetical protein